MPIFLRGGYAEFGYRLHPKGVDKTLYSFWNTQPIVRVHIRMHGCEPPIRKWRYGEAHRRWGKHQYVSTTGKIVIVLLLTF